MLLVDRDFLNRGVSKDWPLDKKRAYRQVNAFSFFLTVIAISAIPIALYFKVFFGFWVQLIAAITYFSIYFFLSKLNLKIVRCFAIVQYEVHLFAVTLFAVSTTGLDILPYYSPIFICYMLYPLVAALFDLRVFPHMIVAIGQIVIIQAFGSIFSSSSFPKFPQFNSDVLSIVVSVYSILMTTLFVYLLYSENQSVKNLEIERSKELEKLLGEVQQSRAKHKEQAKELKKLNDTKNKFFSVIAHDLKSPYNAVLGFSQVLQDKTIDNPEFHKYATLVHDTALNSYNLLENLLEWSRAQLNQITFEPVRVMLQTAAFKNLQLLQTLASQKNITIKFTTKENIFILADETLLSTVIRNIITNAIKFTEAGGIISISAKAGTKYAEISIADTGIGMSEDQLKKLFRIETKESRLGTRNETGTGLGLLLCKEFVEMHGGKIWAESTEGSGTKFSFTIPLAK